MPILVVCPGCGASLNAPDSGAGKQVRCPKPNCGKLIPVPAPIDAEPVEAEEVPEPRARSTRRRDEDDDRPRRRRDDDDDDRLRKRRNEEGDRPRGRGRDRDARGDLSPALARRRSPAGTGKIVVIVLGSLLVLAGIGYGVYALVSKGGPRTPPPPGWNEYTYKEANFKAHFPKEPKVQIQRAGLGGIVPAEMDGEFAVDSMFMCDAGNMFSDPVSIQVVVMLFNSRVPSAVRNQFANVGRGIDAKEMSSEAKSVRWLGERGSEVTTSSYVTRNVAVDRGVYQVTISGPSGRRAKPEEEQAFFDNFVLLK